MARALQKRTLETRARLIGAAEDLITQNSFEALRVEEVVLRAGVAKGTFFAHFKDKDALMALIIGARIDAILDELAQVPPPRTAQELAEAIMPLANFMTSEHYVFDVILRNSGAMAIEEIGPIAETFIRKIEIFSGWIKQGDFRQDIPPELQAEGIHAFLFQAMATKFCALHSAQSIEERLAPYLKAWLTPSS